MLNQIALVGRIVRDPELKESSNKKPFCVVTLAVTRAYKNRETNEYDTDFVDVTAWGSMARNMVTHCGKGSLVAMRGRVANRMLEFPGNQSFRSISIIGERVSFIHTKPPTRSEEIISKAISKEEGVEVDFSEEATSEEENEQLEEEVNHEPESDVEAKNGIKEIEASEQNPEERTNVEKDNEREESNDVEKKPFKWLK